MCSRSFSLYYRVALFRGEAYRKLTLPENPHADDNGDGYTNLENWLHAFAAEVERNK